VQELCTATRPPEPVFGLTGAIAAERRIAVSVDSLFD
jgi:hypothetical protein